MPRGNKLATVPLWCRFELIRLVQSGKAGEDYTVPEYREIENKVTLVRRAHKWQKNTK